MQDSADYRIIDRKKYAVIMVLLISLLAVVVWFGLDRVAEYVKELEELTANGPLKAAATIMQLLRTLAILNGIVLSLLSILIIWHGWRGWRTKSMPPRGSWIVEGQRTWSGESAVRVAKFKITVGVLLGILAAFSSFFLWGLGDTLTDLTMK